ncbi:blue light sensor protein [Epibacterium sp. SM1969]|uniref:Blue light sensor protein n=1 Tax=Tritonibacter aquimaris TaxID=2663379 RepID=A0A844AQ18_9RHOB|nr:BLUF domain-containing protein [Tritonibacter aquimaris]MQY41018.1 blue light sensor protein [Tritonibacter aquimaris]
MHRLIYLSQLTRNMSHNEVAAMVARAQERNKSAGLTGLLIFMQGRFFQVLEGPETAVDHCFARIQQDTRHGGMRLLSSSEIKTRAFPDWKMSLFYPEQLPQQAHEAVMSIDTLLPMNSPERGDCPKVRGLVREFLASFTRMAAA